MRTVIGLVGLVVLAAAGCGGRAVSDEGAAGGGAAGAGGASTGGTAGTAGTGGSATVDAGGTGGGSVDEGGSGGIDGGGTGGATDAGPGDSCAPGFCQDLMMSSCGDPSFIPMGGMSCTGAAGGEGFCCLPSCGGFGGEPCPDGQYCYYPPNLGPACGAFDGVGACQLAPVGCDDDCPGVCGCDGQFYCNACTAHQSGTDVSDSMSCVTDGGMAFVDQLEGIWLIGWSGGMNHYSWVRFHATSPYGGTASLLAGDDLPVNAPYWPCTGAGGWAITAKPDTIQLEFPATCTGMGFEALSFVAIGPASGYPADAILWANIETTSNPGAYLEGYSFPPSQCDVAMTTCQNPFGY